MSRDIKLANTYREIRFDARGLASIHDANGKRIAREIDPRTHTKETEIPSWL